MLPSARKARLQNTDKDAKFRTLEAEVVSAGIAPAKFLPLFRKKLLATPDPERAFNNFLRFIASGFTSSLLRTFLEHPVLLTIALTLFGHSQYLADILVRSPELFHWLTATNALVEARQQEDYLRDAFSVISPFERTDRKFDALKRFQRREILKISTRDILKEADLVTITAELSWLADSIVDAALRIGIEDLGRRLGSEITSTICVVGLGKLGGTELNFSSDIDLMFVYDVDGELDYSSERIYSFHEYYCRVAEFVVRRLSEHTDEGHLYRVDMRLRPDGASGPLAMSRQGYLRYYETRGELWERQMLLKARVIAGNREVGEQFLRDLRPFVYPSTVLHDPRDEILKIKRRIEATVPGETNVKLSKGGIRDIEFVIQALQLLQSDPSGHCRESNTLRAIEKLRNASLLTRTEAERLRNGYEFLRQVEHRLQLLHGTQIHELPENKEELWLLGRRLGFKSASAFEGALARTQRQIRTVYDSFFHQPQGGSGKSRVRKPISEQALIRTIKQSGFIDHRRAAEIIRELQKASMQFEDPDTLERLLVHLRKNNAPDLGLMNFRILSSSQHLSRSFSQVFLNDRMFNLIVAICSRSNRLTVLLAREPLLFESLLVRTEDFFKPEVEWTFLLNNDPVRFREFNECKVLISYLAGESSTEEMMKGLATIADTVVHSVIEDLLARTPECRSNVCIIALGKYGGQEILIGSDLDLLILFHDSAVSDSDDSNEMFAREFVQSFVTESGHVYDIDLRLRPEGKNAPLATDLSYYEKYLSDRAELWEQQALLKTRIIFDEGEGGGKFEALKARSLARIVKTKDWPRQMLAMKSKMEQERMDARSRQRDLKIGKGGLIDLEFLVQAAQLKYHSVNNSGAFANTSDAINQFGKLDLLNKKELEALRSNYAFLRKLELSIRLNAESMQFILPEDEIVLHAIAASVGLRSVRSLKDQIRDVALENRRLMKKVFAGIGS